MRPAPVFATIALALVLASSGVTPRTRSRASRSRMTSTFRTADIMSEGTRMAAEVFAPKDPKSEKLPPS